MLLASDNFIHSLLIVFAHPKYSHWYMKCVSVQCVQLLMLIVVNGLSNYCKMVKDA